MKQPILAVRSGLKVNINFTMKLISLFNDKKLLKLAWIELIKLTPNNNEKDLYISYLLQNKIFKFEELIEYLGENEYFYNFNNIFLTEIKNIELENNKIYEKIEIPKNKNKTKRLSPDDKCLICNLSLFDSNIVLFPCNHLIHKNCLLRNNNFINSCPICGFISINNI